MQNFDKFYLRNLKFDLNLKTLKSSNSQNFDKFYLRNLKFDLNLKTSKSSNSQNLDILSHKSDNFCFRNPKFWQIITLHAKLLRILTPKVPHFDILLNILTNFTLEIQNFDKLSP